MKAYYNEITGANLDLIKTLKVGQGCMERGVFGGLVWAQWDRWHSKG